MDGTTVETERPAPLMTIDEAAAVLRISKRSLWSLTFPRGPIKPVQLGRSVRYAPATIQRYIQQQISVPPASAA